MKKSSQKLVFLTFFFILALTSIAEASFWFRVTSGTPPYVYLADGTPRSITFTAHMWRLEEVLPGKFKAVPITNDTVSYTITKTYYKYDGTIERIEKSSSSRFTGGDGEVSVSVSSASNEEDAKKPANISIVMKDSVLGVGAGTAMSIVKMGIKWNDTSYHANKPTPVIDGLPSKKYKAEIIPSSIAAIPHEMEYEWRFMPTPSKASSFGNNPICAFEPGDKEETIVPLTKWFAYPNHPDNALAKSTYAIFCEPTIKFPSKQFKVPSYGNALKVYVPEHGGVTLPGISGLPDMEQIYSKKDKKHYWVIMDPGEIHRIVVWYSGFIKDSPKTQFKQKIEQHEQMHYRQFFFGGHTVYERKALESTTVDELMQFIKKLKLKAETKEELENRYAKALHQYMKRERDAMAPYIPSLERDAYALSDNINPKFLYTWVNYLKMYVKKYGRLPKLY
ncbi:MAG: hypothetical protein KAI43_05670 [Candidatus Aureabacteria bacterium]|nr:hypothetical protein [Candidatus Auribacterota bacterium]